MTYKFKTKPYSHQLETFEATKHKEAFAILWEQGTGKTKLTLDTGANLYLEDKIDCLLVIAPNGVHTNWVSEEVGIHLPDEIDFVSYAYHSKTAKRATSIKQRKEVLGTSGLAVVALAYSTLRTKGGEAFLKEVLATRNCLFVLDESTYIKNPTAERTKVAIKHASKAEYRRILTGTPITNSPFDIYSQMLFLDKMFWKTRGIGTYSAFRYKFAVYGEIEIPDRRPNSSGTRTIKTVSAFRNLHQLRDLIKEHSSRVLKEDVLDLPPKIFSKRYFNLSPKQRKVYNQLKDNVVAELDGGMIDGSFALSKLLRLQQITSGYVPVETIVATGDGYAEIQTNFSVIDPKNDPRMEVLLETLETLEGSTIIWARFTDEIRRIKQKLGDEACCYYGETGLDAREDAKKGFQSRKYKYFIANPQACAMGITLTAAENVIYFSNSWDLSLRLQSEDRAHRIGQTKNVNYIDIIANHTVDQEIVAALLNKLSIASQITGDGLKKWIG